MKEESKKDVNHKVILNLIQNLPRKVVSQRQQQRQTWKIPYQVRDDRPLLNNGNGFTLIELLVVVLIIGILAAVALPQYKLAVAKARMTQLVTLANAVVQAQERYYLANGEYTNDWALLDIEVQGNGTGRSRTNPAGWRLELTLNKLNSGQPDAVYATDSRLPGVLLIFSYQHSTWAGARGCWATQTSQLANVLCKNATGKTAAQSNNGDQYGYYF